MVDSSARKPGDGLTSAGNEVAPAERAVEAFAVVGAPLSAERLGIGRIHQTYVVSRNAGRETYRYILQRINSHVFGSPVPLMENIRRVTEHLRHRLAEEGWQALAARVLSVVPTKGGQACYQDDEGHWWRVYSYVEDSRSWNVAKTPEIAYQGASAFGHFVRLLGDLPGPRLHETIPHFHDTPRWLQTLRGAVEKDPCNRASGAADAIAFVESRVPLTHALSHTGRMDTMPERVVHNDTKINNVLFDRRSGQAVCVVDLDTVMPGLVVHDFGDLVRTTVNPAREDEADLDAVTVRLPVFEAVVRGYLAGTGSLLTGAELDLMAVSSQVITLELGMRFLWDHLQGDVYFTTTQPGQNLNRAQLQFRLLENLEAYAEDMARIVETARQR